MMQPKYSRKNSKLVKLAVAAGITLFGSLHCALTVFGDTPDQARSNGIKLSAEFITSGKGFRFSRASLASPFVFQSYAAE